MASTVELKTLSTEQIAMIQKTWKIPGADYIDFGELLLITFFEKHPRYQKIFTDIREKPVKELKGYSKLRYLGAKVMVFIALMVDTLDRDGLEGVRNLILDLGKFHVDRGLTNKQAFQELRDVFLFLLSEVAELKAEEKDAWKILMDFYCRTMFMVFDENTL